MANLSQQLAVASLFAIGLWGCNSGQPSAVSTPNGKSASGTTAAIAQPSEPISDAKRTVALSSLAADILYQLDPDKLVGVVHDRNVSDHADLSQYPDIGDGREFDVKAIIDLRPDLVVGIEGVHERILAQLDEAGIPTQRYRLDGWDSLFATIEDLARATSTDPTPLLDRYAALRPASTSDDSGDSSDLDNADDSEQPSNSAALDNSDRAATTPQTEDAETDTETAIAQATTDETTDTTKTASAKALKESDETEESADESASESASESSADNPDRSSTLILASRDPLFSLNRKSWGGNAIEPFTHNIAANLDEQRSAAGYVTLEPEAIAEADPDTILIIETPGSAAPIAEFESLPFWQDLQAVKNDRVFLVDYYGLVKPATLANIDTTINQLADIFDMPYRTAREIQLKSDISVTRRSFATQRPAS